ncbi:multidrug efflux SMR transporter [Microbacterium yannicii]|uniref:Multidrug efflux SMR transporter n=1 Tax=Microbacterium yannicii TaxID=671622 RepID=A0ABP9MLL8_9MICO|nr:multidrug efflux SMR transporter [Microbacterium yannicii]MCO5953277.1 multidrug efflux SMR transporter [Microbacterium yannicii]
MSWIVLIVSGVLEAVWATALGKSEGFTKLWPTVVFAVSLALSMGGLAWAMRDISTGTAYAVWVGIGASLTVAYAMITGDEAFSIVRMLLILGLVGCVVGLKLVGHD